MNRRDFFHRSAIAAAGAALCGKIATWFKVEDSPHAMLLYLADGPLGPAFVSPSIITPYGRTNVVADSDGTEHFYTVFHVTSDVMFFRYDPAADYIVFANEKTSEPSAWQGGYEAMKFT